MTAGSKPFGKKGGLADIDVLRRYEIGTAGWPESVSRRTRQRDTEHLEHLLKWLYIEERHMLRKTQIWGGY